MTRCSVFERLLSRMYTYAIQRLLYRIRIVIDENGTQIIKNKNARVSGSNNPT